MNREILFENIRRLCVRYRADRPISNSGRLQNWLIDLRPALLDPNLLRAMANLFWEQFADSGPLQIGTIETAGIPLLTAILLYAPSSRPNISGFIVRKTRKTTGMGNNIEGTITDDPIILVDDILNSASSAEIARVAINLHGRSIEGMFAVIDYHNPQADIWRREHHIKMNSLFSLSEFGLSLVQEKHEPKQSYRELWRVCLSSGFPYHVVPKSAPVLVDKIIFRGSDAGFMHAFDANSGHILWAHEASGATRRKGIWSTPAIHDERLYYGAYNGVVYALDARTGREIWAQSCCEWIGASPLVVPQHDLLFIGLEYERPWARGALTALNLNTGAKVWEHLVAEYQHGPASYWHGGDLVIWGTADHYMLALKPKTGEPVWTFETGRSVKCAAAIDEERGVIAFASFDKSIYLLGAATGEKLGEWKTNDICYTTPLFSRGRLFCGSGDRHLYVIDVDKRELIKKIEFDARLYSSPTQIGDRIIFGTCSGRVVELDANTLEIVGVLQLPDAITNSIAIGMNGRQIYVSTYMNHLFAFERN